MSVKLPLSLQEQVELQALAEICTDTANSLYVLATTKAAEACELKERGDVLVKMAGQLLRKQAYLEEEELGREGQQERLMHHEDEYE